MKYSITSQTDLETYPILMGANDTATLANDIALDANWTPIASMSGTLDGAGYKITNMTNRVRNFITADQTNSGVSFSSTNYGKVHTISWRQGCSGSGIFDVIAGSSQMNSITWKLSDNRLWYYAGGGYGVNWSVTETTTPRTFTIVRNGTALQLFIDGSAQASRTLPSNVDFTVSNFMTHHSGTWSGNLAEVLITSDAKDGTWAVQNANGTLGRYNTSSNTSNLVSLWHMDEASGTTVADSVGSLTGTGVDGWTTAGGQGGLIDSLSGTIKNLTIDTPNIANTQTTCQQGVFANLGAGTLDACYAKDVTITNTGATNIRIGGLVGYWYGGTIKNCRADITSLPTTAQTVYWGSAGIIARALGVTIQNTYSTGGETSKPDCGLIANASNCTVTNCFSTCDADRYEIAYYNDTSGSASGVRYYNRSKGGDNRSRSTAVTTLSDFYTITNAPMSSWDFTWGGYWSPSQNGVTYPPFLTDFNANISGTVTGYSSGKNITLIKKNKTYYVKQSNSWDGVGVLSSALTLGYVHTIAWTGIDFASNTAYVLRNNTNPNTGIFCLNGNTWRYATSISSIFTIAPVNTAVSGKHRYVVARNGNTLDFYVDGVKIQTTTGLGTATANNWDRIVYGYSGSMDEVVITNDYKDQAWVTTDWDGGSYKNRYIGTETGVIHLWHFDENPIYPTAYVAVDSVGAINATMGRTATAQETFDYPTWDTDTVVTTGSGDFTFTGVSDTHGKPIIIYIDGETEKGGVVTTLTEGTTAITGVTIEQGTISIGEAELEPNMTYANVALADAYPITDTCFRTANNIIYYRDGCDALVPLDCTYSGMIVPDTSELGALVNDGTLELVGGAQVNNDVINTGTIIYKQGTINGDITNSGTWTSDFLTVRFYGSEIENSGTMNIRVSLYSDVNFIGDITFGNTAFMVADKTYTFEAGSTYTFDGVLDSNYGTLGNEIKWRSDSPGTRYNISYSGSFNFMDIQDCNASTADINFIRSINSGGNDNREASPHCIFWEYQNAFINEHN